MANLFCRVDFTLVPGKNTLGGVGEVGDRASHLQTGGFWLHVFCAARVCDLDFSLSLP